MNRQPILRDERYTTIENASFKIGYLILAFGTLLLISFRGFVYQESNWDFFALVIISSFAASLYQYRHKIISFSKKEIYFIAAIILIAALVAYLAGLLVR